MTTSPRSPRSLARALPVLALLATACSGATGANPLDDGGGDAGTSAAGGASAGGAASGHAGAGGSAKGGASAGGASAGGGAGAGGASVGGASAGGASAAGTSANGGASAGAGGAAASGAAGQAAGGAGASAGGASAGAGGVAAGGGAAGSGAAGAAGSAGQAGAAGTTGSGGACSAASELVYVFSITNEIYSFDPPTKKFTKIATPDCAVAGGTANSMAIDRNLVAWLNYIGGPDGGALFTFDLKTKTGCQPSGIALPSGFTQVGMGFSTDTVGGVTETLFVGGIGGGGLAKVDPIGKKLSPIGAFGNDAKLQGQSAELTGTGDARLFGYFTTSPDVRVAEIDKGNASVISDVALMGVTPPSDWAFTFWGGDFYLYAAPGSNSTGNSSVVHYDPMTGTVDKTYVADVGFVIIGAGVSTCAPTHKP